MHDPRLAARVLRDAPIAVVVVDLDGAICHANARFERLTGLSFSELQGSSWVGAFFPEAERPRICALLHEGVTIDEITELVIADGGVRYLHWNVDASRDDDGRVTGWVAVAQDVTARHRRRLAEGDEHRRVLETLLREIHHRVKNNLQVVSSLLYLHERRLHAPEDIAGVADLRRRLVSMALVHERLHRSPDVGRVDFGEYVRMLVRAIGRSFVDGDGVQVDVDCDLLWLPIEQAVPCGMLLNELVTNVWKDVLEGNGDGHATIALRTVGGRVVLTVDDDGRGSLQRLSEPHDGPSGWDLVHALVEQLGGDVDVGATRLRITFPAPAP